MSVVPRFEEFEHQADIGIRGHGRTIEEAFEQAALALASAVVPPAAVKISEHVHVVCSASDRELLFLDWLNAIIYQMAASTMVFAQFTVRLRDGSLHGDLAGERLDLARHEPGVEVKAATPACLQVREVGPEHWVAQCVVDV